MINSPENDPPSNQMQFNNTNQAGMQNTQNQNVNLQNNPSNNSSVGGNASQNQNQNNSNAGGKADDDKSIFDAIKKCTKAAAMFDNFGIFLIGFLLLINLDGNTFYAAVYSLSIGFQFMVIGAVMFIWEFKTIYPSAFKTVKKFAINRTGLIFYYFWIGALSMGVSKHSPHESDEQRNLGHAVGWISWLICLGNIVTCCTYEEPEADENADGVGGNNPNNPQSNINSPQDPNNPNNPNSFDINAMQQRQGGWGADVGIGNYGNSFGGGGGNYGGGVISGPGGGAGVGNPYGGSGNPYENAGGAGELGGIGNNEPVNRSWQNQADNPFGDGRRV